MSQIVSAECDGPGCEEVLDNVKDDELEAKGWLQVLMPDEDDDARTRDFCSMACLSEWSRLEALLP